ncbi:MAG: hypothetical protein IKU45_01055 [Clostridia bacterium]|nr:hypothetical protein [Clostridia bacterium]
MAQVFVSIQEIKTFEKSVTQLKEGSRGLTIAQKEIKEIQSQISDAQKKVSDNIEKLSDTTKELTEAIHALDAKIKIEEARKLQKEAEAHANPKKDSQLRAEIKKITSNINRLKTHLGKCDAAKRCIAAHKSKLAEFSRELGTANRDLGEIAPILKKCELKLMSNSEQASMLLQRIESALERYFKVPEPIACDILGIHAHRTRIISCVNQNPELLRSGEAPSTKRIGNYGEMRTSNEMHDKRYFELTRSPLSLDEKLTHGIDHVFFKDGVYYICDSKCGPGAHLEAMTATGPQLSDTWIDARLDSAIGKAAADKIREKMIFDPESVKRFVSKINIGEKTVYESVDENGQICGEGDDLDALFG